MRYKNTSTVRIILCVESEGTKSLPEEDNDERSG